MGYDGRWATVRVDLEDRIAWITLNRPEKRNAISPRLNAEMIDVLKTLEADERCGVLVLTGAGEAFSAGMDLEEFFREVDGKTESAVINARRDSATWQWRLLRAYPKPTIAMVNGWCFGGAFTPLVSCDLAIAADEATFGLSEVNWGIPPGGVVSKAVTEVIGLRAATYYTMTAEPFGGKRAAEMGLVNASVPLQQLRATVKELAEKLLEKSPYVLRAAKIGLKHCRDMSWDQAEDYLFAKLEQSQFLDPERARERGMAAFLDEKSYRPGLEHFPRTGAGQRTEEGPREG